MILRYCKKYVIFIKVIEKYSAKEALKLAKSINWC